MKSNRLANYENLCKRKNWGHRDPQTNIIILFMVPIAMAAGRVYEILDMIDSIFKVKTTLKDVLHVTNILFYQLMIVDTCVRFKCN